MLGAGLFQLEAHTRAVVISIEAHSFMLVDIVAGCGLWLYQ